MDDVVEVTSSGSLESGQPKREGRSKSQGRTVVAQNGTSITGTSVKSKSSQGPSTSGERRRSPRPPANDAELSDPIDGVRGSSSEAAARTAPAQLRSWLERAHQEANALYTSGALNGFRSGVELSLKPCMNHCWSWFSIQILQGTVFSSGYPTLSHAQASQRSPQRGRPNYFTSDASMAHDPRVEMFAQRSLSPVPRGMSGSFVSPTAEKKDEALQMEDRLLFSFLLFVDDYLLFIFCPL